MNTPCNLPYLEIPIDKTGNFVNASQLHDIAAFLSARQGRTTDLFVMSHGWNTTEDDARSLYERFFTQFCETPGVTAQRFAVMGILWPSEKFADASEIPGGAASLDDDPEAQRAFVDGLRAQLPKDPPDEEGMRELFEMPGDELLQLLSESPAETPQTGDGEGCAQGLISGMKRAALDLLNVTTYYIMKNRSGLVGRTAVSQALNRIQTAFPNIRIHLIGHSFGARVVTSAAATVSRPAASMTLLQAAFSQNSFSPDFDATHTPGAFRSVIVDGKVSGPILISHSIKDLAVGLAYAVVSRLARQNGAAIADANDPYGGLGSNGARKTPEAIDGDLQSSTATYNFGNKIYNLKADTIVMGHTDIVKPEIANALLQAAGIM